MTIAGFMYILTNKNMIHRCILTGFFLLLLTFSFSNTAQPGIWGAGGGGFTLLFPEDSIGYKKIQMQRERVSIQLYKGFAVVKGEYWMRNTTDDSIIIRAGYPLNATWDSYKNASDLTEIYFDQLYQLRVKIDGQNAEIIQSPMEAEQPNVSSFNDPGENNWYVWSMEFKPADITKIEVYFLVNTNDAKVSLGYSKESYNGFVYILESGATWKPPIGEGTIMIQLKDGLGKNDVHGISPDSAFHYDENSQILLYQFQNLEPTNEDNIALTYSERIADFPFEQIVNKADDYFAEIEQLSQISLEQGNYIPVDFGSPFDISSVNAVSVFFFVVVFVIPLLLVLGVGFVIYQVVKRRRRT